MKFTTFSTIDIITHCSHFTPFHNFTGEEPTELLAIGAGVTAAGGAALLLDEGCRLRLASSRIIAAKSNA